MKVSIDIDCTPEEARAFFGLPDVGPMQQALLKDLEERMRANLAAIEPEALFKTWLPASIAPSTPISPRDAAKKAWAISRPCSRSTGNRGFSALTCSRARLAS